MSGRGGGLWSSAAAWLTPWGAPARGGRGLWRAAGGGGGRSNVRRGTLDGSCGRMDGPKARSMAQGPAQEKIIRGSWGTCPKVFFYFSPKKNYQAYQNSFQFQWRSQKHLYIFWMFKFCNCERRWWMADEHHECFFQSATLVPPAIINLQAREQNLQVEAATDAAASRFSINSFASGTPAATSTSGRARRRRAWRSRTAWR